MVDKILLSSLPANQITLSKKSGDYVWDDLLPKIESNWNELRRSRERAVPGVIVATYRFDLSPSLFVKFDVRITHEQWKAAQEFAKQDAASVAEKWVDALSGVSMKKPLFNSPKQRHKPKPVFWRQLPGSYGSTQ